MRRTATYACTRESTTSTSTTVPTTKRSWPTSSDSSIATSFWLTPAGLCPRANDSGTFAGATKVSGRGRPALRTAAWRALWGELRHNPVYAARFQYLTGRADNPLRRGQARAAIAAALLRQLFVVVTRRVAWDPAIAAGHIRQEVAPTAA